MPHRINGDACIACGACQTECPVQCISEEDDGIRKIDENACIDCGRCAVVCPVSCISKI